MNEQIRQHNIKKFELAAWMVCDMKEVYSYRDYIFALLFVKYISDVWQGHYETYQRRYGDNEELIPHKLRNERFILPQGYSFYDLYEKRSEANIGALITIALHTIETANKTKLGGIFHNITNNSQSHLKATTDYNRCIEILLENFNKPGLDMHPSRIPEDVIGNFYTYLIERFGAISWKTGGEFYTPHKVSELVAKLCAPKPGARICDPACGSGGTLIATARVVGDKNHALYGMEVNSRTWALARMNMFLHGADDARIEWCNTLTAPALVENNRLMKFDCVVSNPPFLPNNWGIEDAKTDPYNRFWRGVPPKSMGCYAFICHMVEAAVKKKGRIVVVVSHGVLSRGGTEGCIRRKLIEENLLDAVIGLPANLFPSASIPVAILIFDRSREAGGKNEKRKNVIFIDASREYIISKNQNYLLDEHLDKIIATCKNRKDVEKYAHVADFSEVEGNEFNLNIPRYVDTFEEGGEI